MMTIFKYSILPRASVGIQSVEMPAGAEFLSIAAQGYNAVMWFRVNDPAPRMVMRHFETVLTGREIPAGNLVFRGTVMFDGGDFVAHVFEHV